MNTAVTQFSTYLSEIDTEPELRNVIVGQLAEWMVLPSTELRLQIYIHKQ